ncbi:MAG TPA: NUDIX domain-containing protein [Lacisediminihabitans sp.]|uniref:NUDIX hydrolase n=1 Tax=Lacisediminihabitans sp. TaxID=2787631 RepID=UPI002ED811D0
MPIQSRLAARVLVIDEAGRVLLFEGGDPGRPDAGTWWFTPGGGLETGETPLDAARRELREETGLLTTELDGPIHSQDIEYEFQGTLYQQHEDFFVVRAPAFEPDRSGWTVLEQATMSSARWWSRDELASSDELVYPQQLLSLLRSIDPG